VRKVDQDAFELANQLLRDGLNDLKSRLQDKDHEINQLRAENKLKDEEAQKLRDEVQALRDLVNQMKGALLAAGVKLDQP
jgi:predicted nuclease with TOPRIM domain